MCYSVSASCGIIEIANIEINRDGMKNHVGRDATATSMEDPVFSEKKR